jgi:phage protein D
VPGNTSGAPRVWAQINGADVDSVMHANISNNGSCKSSRFELTVSTSGNTQADQWLPLIAGKVTVAIYMRSRRGENGSTMFEGLADNIAIDPINSTARITGRDYSSVLISSTYQDSFFNQTASEIANSIAARHGFVQNISPTSTMVGSYQCDGYNQVLLNAHSHITSEWDLLKSLAKTERFQLFVSGVTLNFAPAEALSRNARSIGADNVIALTFHKICPTSDQMALTAKSWNSWLSQALTYSDDQSADQSAFALPTLNADPAAEVALVRPNLTSQDAERLVNQRLDALNEQSMTVQIVMPGEMSLMPGDILFVNSGNSIADGNYIVRSIRRQFSTTAGFIQYIQGSAMTANSSVSLGDRILPSG